MTLESRYGVKKRSRNSLIAGSLLALIMVLFGLWFLLSGGLPTNNNSLSYRDISHEIESDYKSNVTYEVVTPANRQAICALEAMSPSHATVGLVTVVIPPSEEITRVFNQSIKTTHRATTATVRKCWFERES